jgi:hypothetical protein
MKGGRVMPRKSGTSKKTAVILILSLLILTVTVGSTVAYFIDRTDALENDFVPVMVDAQPLSTPDGIAIRNTGEIDAYIRCTVVVNWVSVDGEGNPGGHVHSTAPVEGTDYSIFYDNSGAWMKGSDGFWYYKVLVSPSGVTDELILDYTRLTDPPEGYSLSIRVLATGIQATPSYVVEEVFGVTVNGTNITVD